MTDELKDDRYFLAEALAEAEKGMADGGLPIGAVLVRGGEIIGRGHNQRVQQGDPIAHGEMDCFRKAGRQKTYSDTVLYTTLSPCMMCTGTIIQFGVPRVVVGEAENFEGNMPFLRERGVEVVLMDDEGCKDAMRRFLAVPGNLALWHEDIAED